MTPKAYAESVGPPRGADAYLLEERDRCEIRRDRQRIRGASDAEPLSGYR